MEEIKTFDELVEACEKLGLKTESTQMKRVEQYNIEIFLQEELSYSLVLLIHLSGCAEFNPYSVSMRMTLGKETQRIWFAHSKNLNDIFDVIKPICKLNNDKQRN